MKHALSLTAAMLLAAALSAGPSLAQVPEISFDSAPNLLKLPEHTYLGEAAGVATNSKGNLFVYTRTGERQRHSGGLAHVHSRRLAPVRVRFER